MDSTHACKVEGEGQRNGGSVRLNGCVGRDGMVVRGDEDRARHVSFVSVIFTGEDEAKKIHWSTNDNVLFHMDLTFRYCTTQIQTIYQSSYKQTTEPEDNIHKRSKCRKQDQKIRNGSNNKGTGTTERKDKIRESKDQRSFFQAQRSISSRA